EVILKALSAARWSDDVAGQDFAEEGKFIEEIAIVDAEQRNAGFGGEVGEADVGVATHGGAGHFSDFPASENFGSSGFQNRVFVVQMVHGEAGKILVVNRVCAGVAASERDDGTF